MNLLIISNPQSPTTDLLRTSGAFMKVKMPGLVIRIVKPQDMVFTDILFCDAVLLQRPNGDMISAIITEAKRMKKAVILDIDDNLHEVDRTNPSYKHFANPAVRSSIEFALSKADHVIYSTPNLKEYYAPMHTCPGTVVYNAVDFTLTPLQEPKPVDDTLKVLWRGSEHHIADLESISEFWKYIVTRPKTKTAFLGLQAHYMATHYPEIEVGEWQPSTFGYLELISKLEPSIGVFPLLPTKFNLGKSGLFAQEMLTVGCLPLVSAGFEEFKHPGIVHFDSAKDLINSLSSMEKRRGLTGMFRMDTIKAGQEWIYKYRNLEEINERRREILESL